MVTSWGFCDARLAMLASAGCDFLVNQKYKPAPIAAIVEPRKARRGTLDDVSSAWSDSNIRPSDPIPSLIFCVIDVHLQYGISGLPDFFRAAIEAPQNLAPSIWSSQE